MMEQSSKYPQFADLENKVPEIEARLSKITPGQWESDINRDGWLQVISRTMEGKLTSVCGLGDMEDTEAEDHANSEFIGNAPDDIRALLALIQLLKVQLASVGKAFWREQNAVVDRDREIARLKSEIAILENGRAILKGTIDKFVHPSKSDDFSDDMTSDLS